MKHAATYAITGYKYDSKNEKFSYLEINGEPVVEGGSLDLPFELYIWKTNGGDYLLFPFSDSQTLQDFDEFKNTPCGHGSGVAGYQVTLAESYIGFRDVVAIAAPTSDVLLLLKSDNSRIILRRGTAATRIATLDNVVATSIDVSTYTEPVSIAPSEGKDAMLGATVTLTNIPSEVSVEDNKAASIDVSSYSDPVEITPTSGKDAMAKVTVTLTNIPSGGGATLYAWDCSGTTCYFNFAVAPESITDEKGFYYDFQQDEMVWPTSLAGKTYSKTSDTAFTLDGNAFTRNATDDFIW